MDEVDHLDDIRDDEGAVSAGRVVVADVLLLGLGVGDISVDFGPVEGGHSWTEMGFRLNQNLIFGEGALQEIQPRGHLLALLDEELEFDCVVEVQSAGYVAHLLVHPRKLLLETDPMLLQGVIIGEGGEGVQVEGEAGDDEEEEESAERVGHLVHALIITD